MAESDPSENSDGAGPSPDPLDEAMGSYDAASSGTPEAAGALDEAMSAFDAAASGASPAPGDGADADGGAPPPYGFPPPVPSGAGASPGPQSGPGASSGLTPYSATGAAPVPGGASDAGSGRPGTAVKMPPVQPPYGQDDVVSARNKLRTLILEEEQRFDEAKQKFQERRQSLDALVDTATQNSMVLPSGLLPSLTDAFRSIQKYYNELCDRYLEFERGEITLNQYSRFLDKYMENYAARSIEINAMDVSFMNAKTNQINQENRGLCDGFYAELMNITRLLDECRAGTDVYIFKWAAQLQEELTSTTRRIQSDARPKVNQTYRDLVKDPRDMGKDHLHWLKRALERKTYELYVASPNAAVSNESMLSLMKNAAGELSVICTENDYRSLERDATALDDTIGNRALAVTGYTNFDALRRGMEQLQMADVKRVQLSGQLDAANNSIAQLAVRLDSAKEQTAKLEEERDDFADRFGRAKTYGFLGGITGVVLGLAGGALLFRLYTLPMKTKEITAERDLAVAAQKQVENERDSAREEVSTLNDKVAEIQAELAKRYTQEQVDEAVAEAREGFFTEEQVDERVAEAREGFFTEEQVDERVAEALENMYSQEQLDERVAEAKTKARENMYTQEQVDQAVAREREGLLSSDEFNKALAREIEKIKGKDTADAFASLMAEISQYKRHGTPKQFEEAQRRVAALEEELRKAGERQYTQAQLDEKVKKAVEEAKTKAGEGMFSQDQLDAAVADAKKGLYSQEQLDERVAEARENMVSQDKVDAAVAEATRDMYTEGQVNERIAKAVADAGAEAGKYTEGQVNAKVAVAVADARKGMYTQDQFDKAVAEAREDMFSQDQLDAAVADAKRGLYSQDQLDERVAEAKEGLFTEEQLRKAVEEERTRIAGAELADIAAELDLYKKHGTPKQFRESQEIIAKLEDDLRKARKRQYTQAQLDERVAEAVEEVRTRLASTGTSTSGTGDSTQPIVKATGTNTPIRIERVSPERLELIKKMLERKSNPSH